MPHTVLNEQPNDGRRGNSTISVLPEYYSVGEYLVTGWLRGRLLRAVAFVSVLMMLAACGEKPDEEKALPPNKHGVATFSNVIVIVIDALRADHMSAYGYQRKTSPFMDHLAAEGIQVSAYSATSWTRPSTATILTGLYPQRHTTNQRNNVLPADACYLPELLSSAGLASRAYVTNGNVSTDFGFSRGFERFDEFTGKGKPDAPDELAAALSTLDGISKPFFFYLHVIDPHDPYFPREYWKDSPFRGEGRASFVQPQDIRRGKVEASHEATARMVDQYDAEILELDVALGGFFDRLEAANLLDDTLVVITSDHGEEFSEHGGFAHGHTLFEESVSVPLIFWSADGRLPAHVSDGVFHQVDLAPTLFEALDVPATPEFDGRSQWDALCAKSFSGRGEYLLHLDLDTFSKIALRSGDLKLVVDRNRSETELYDLAVDPSESSALGLLHMFETWSLRRQLESMDAELRNRAFQSVTNDDIREEVEEQLRALGYVE